MPLTRIAVAAALVIAGSLPNPATAQEREAATANPPTAASPAYPLAGPTLAPAAPAKPTLVQRDFAGKLVRLDLPPAEAAANVLDLDPPTRAKVDAILLARAALLDRIVSENLQLLARLQGLRESPDKAKAREALQDLVEVSVPLRARGTLASELAGALPAEQAARLRSMTEEYVRAAIAERAAEKSAGKNLSFRERARAQREAARDETLAMVGQEFRRAYERTIGQRTADFDAILKEFSVTPEQESKIRRIVQDNIVANGGTPTAAQRSNAFWDIYAVLDPTQREHLLKRVAEERAASRVK